MPPDTANSAQRDDPEGWATVQRFLPYLWPADNPALKRRIVGAMMFVLRSPCRSPIRERSIP